MRFALLLLRRQRPSTCSDSTGVFVPDNLGSFLPELIDMPAVFGFLNPQLPHKTLCDQLFPRSSVNESATLLTAKRTCVNIPEFSVQLCVSTLITAAE